MEICHAKSNRHLVSLSELTKRSTIKDVKEYIGVHKRKYADLNRQELRQEPSGKALKDEITLEELGLNNGAMLYFKDRGLQIGWSTVFVCEYAGPLLVYLWISTRPWIFFGDVGKVVDKPVVNIAALCWAGHYAKRILETLFVHRFSNATMPIMNLFKNCTYYWGFAAYVSYHVNHPLYTAPCDAQVYAGLAGFLLCELGNFSIHWALRCLRPAGSKVRKIPVPTGNPMTCLFSVVSCPNYTYEIGAWICFSVMTQCVPGIPTIDFFLFRLAFHIFFLFVAGLFTLAGAYQMIVWALGKHRNYRKEFEKYPRGRKAIFPFII